MGVINVLDIQVANLIAAGEVVDRPASAVKELIENSIDAGADKITVEIKKGGISFIRVCDNGKGMSRDDVPVCIKRHATSKISNQWDLGKITTLGFRGEALAAISAVSKVRIMTKRREDKTGTLMMCEPGGEVVLTETGCPDGTTVIVEELFANVPARRKFLKKDMTEGMAIANMVEKLALSRSDISFKFIYDDNVKFVTAGDKKLINVIYAIYGREFAKKMTAVDWMTDGVKVYGYIGNPDNTKNNRNQQIFFVNNRYVRNKTMSAAIEQAFDSYIPEDKFPSCVLKIDVHPAFVDANVHPSKAEVKFSDEKQIFDAVYSTVRSALERKVKRPELLDFESGDYSNVFTAADQRRSEKEGRELINSFVPVEDRANGAATVKSEPLTFTNEMKDIPSFDFYKSSNTIEKANESFNASTSNNEKSNLLLDVPFNDDDVLISIPKINNFAVTSEEKTTSVPVKTDNSESISENEETTMPDSSFVGDYGGRLSSPNGKYLYDEKFDERSTELPFYKIIGEAFYSYIFIELKDRILVVDKHAAHERIIFEKLKSNMKKSKDVLQFLLVPIKVALDFTERAVVEDYWDDISAIGFEMSKGEKENEIMLFAVPLGLDSDTAVNLFTTVITRLKEGTGSAFLSKEIVFEKALYQASCKAAIKAGRPDAAEDTKAFVEKLLSLPDIKYCPHGRPVAFELSKDNLEKQFKRK